MRAVPRNTAASAMDRRAQATAPVNTMNVRTRAAGLSAGAASMSASDGARDDERRYTVEKIGATQHEHNIKSEPARLRSIAVATKHLRQPFCRDKGSNSGADEKAENERRPDHGQVVDRAGHEVQPRSRIARGESRTSSHLPDHPDRARRLIRHEGTREQEHEESGRARHIPCS